MTGEGGRGPAITRLETPATQATSYAVTFLLLCDTNMAEMTSGKMLYLKPKRHSIAGGFVGKKYCWKSVPKNLFLILKCLSYNSQ